MSYDPDLEMILADMREEFIVDTSDQLDTVEKSVELLNQGSGRNDIHILEIKRLIHSIKGSGGSFGFPTISKIAHSMEDYIDTCGSISVIDPIDLTTFVDSVRSILEVGQEPDAEQAHMMLRSLPLGRRQSGKKGPERGSAILVMPQSVQRKIIGHELADFGFRVNFQENPILAVDLALTLKPELIITSQLMVSMTGIELANVLQSISGTQDVNVIILTASKISEKLTNACPPRAKIIQKGPDFSREFIGFMNKTGLLEK